MRYINLGCGNHYITDGVWVNVDSRPFPGVVVHDLMKPLPFQENEFDVLYHSDVLEHLPKRYAPIFTRECYRVLRTGGIIRAVVPDLEKVAREYLNYLFCALEGEDEDRYDWIVTELIDQMTRRRTGGEMMNFWTKKPMPAQEYVFQRVGNEPLGTIQNNVPHLPDEGLPFPEEVDPVILGRFMLSGEVHQWMYDKFSLGRLLKNAGFRNIRKVDAFTSRIPDFHLDCDGDKIRKPDSLFMEAVK